MARTPKCRIKVEPGVRSGQPIIARTRTTVADILALLAAGASHAEILNDFPWLTVEDIQAALQYAADEFRGKAAP